MTFLTNNFICYWLAGSWVAGLEAFTWTTWALAFLIKAHESRLAWVATALFTAMVMTAGSYQLWWSYSAWRPSSSALPDGGMGDIRQALLPVTATALGVLLAMAAVCCPSWPPARSPSATAASTTTVSLAMDLYGVLAPSSPFHFGRFPRVLGGLRPADRDTDLFRRLVFAAPCAS